MSKKQIALLGLAGFLATTGAAFAQSSHTATTAASEPTVLEISKAGDVLLRGTITAVATDSVTVKSWGGEWTVSVPASATVLPQGVAVSSFQTGDFVGVQGTVDGSASWTVNAKLVHDWTAKQVVAAEVKANVKAVHQTTESAPRTVQGTLSGLDATAQTFTLTNASGAAFSVSLSSSAKLLTKGWTTLEFSKVSEGDTVRVYGTISSSTVTASILRDVSVK